jgi:acyl carrier protein
VCHPPLFDGLATSPPLPTPGQSLGSNPRLFEDLDLNTLARLELVGDLESYYEVQIPDEEIAGLATVRDVEGCLCRRFAQAA